MKFFFHFSSWGCGGQEVSDRGLDDSRESYGSKLTTFVTDEHKIM